MGQSGTNSEVDIDRDAVFETLVASHRAALERLARRLARDAEDAEDLLQETLLDAYRAFARYRMDSHFYSWIARIMTNNHLDRVRRKHHPTVSLDQVAEGEGPETRELPDESRNPERLLLFEQLDPNLETALERLQPAQRATVLLCDLDGATYEEAARVEACPIGTVRSRLHRAHNAIRQFLSTVAGAAEREPETAALRAHSRRDFLRFSTAAAGAALTTLTGIEESRAADAVPAAEEKAAVIVRVLVWSEGTAPKNVYPEDIRGAIAEGLRGEHLQVRTACLDDPEQGVGDAVLAETDVLIWWGNERQDELAADRDAAIARRIRDGMGFIALHSAVRSSVLRAVLGADCAWEGERVDDGSPVRLTVLAPRHPIVRGVEDFRIDRTERYEGRFDGPRPDLRLFEGDYEAGGGSACQGQVWTIGHGRVFYFQPGHETYPIYYQDEVRRVLRNAVGWCAS
jgi:RNA polymerase sigma factor (sigma-70 family)